MTDNISRQAAIKALEGIKTHGVCEVSEKCDETVDNCIEALSALPSVEGWQDMNSAPKNGKSVLLLMGETVPDQPCICVGSFVGKQEGEELGYGQGWLVWSDDGDDYYVEFEGKPTHWIPLPPPPSE